MSRILYLCTLTGFFCSFTGCANFVETRTLNKFATALEEGDLETLKAQSSEHFDEKALRLEESLDDFKLLRIPTAGIEIVTVKDISEDEKHIEANIEGSSSPVYYKLVREEDSRKWVIDDIVIQRKKGAITVEKNVSEQIDLYLSVREFLKSWKNGKRTHIQSHMTPRLAGLMKTLPDSYFSYLNKKTGSLDSVLKKFRPQATIDDNLAIVRLKSKTGILGVVMKLEEERWQVRDMAIEDKQGEHITSLSKAADSLRAASLFLSAYHDHDKSRLEIISANSFFQNALKPGDITTVTLPTTNDAKAKLKLMMPPKRPSSRQRIDLEIPHGDEIVTLTMKSVEIDEEDWKIPGFEVTDVKLSNKDSVANIRKLSAVLTAEARVKIFHEAFVSKNLKVLKYASSFDFNQRVWNRLTDEMLPMVQIELPQKTDFVIENIQYDGGATEVFAMQGNTPITYILREHAGEFRIDDVEMPMPGRPHSFKQFMDIALPVYYFAYSIHKSNVPAELQQIDTLEQRDALTRHFQESLLRFESLCSFDFNHHVWQSTEIIPDMVFSSLQHLTSPITLIDSPQEKIHWVTLGDDDWGARAKVIHERDAYRIDEVKLIAGPGTEADLKLLVQDELNRNGRSIRTLYPINEGTLLADEMPAELNLSQEPAPFQPPSGSGLLHVSGKQEAVREQESWEEIEVDFAEGPDVTVEALEPPLFEAGQ